MPRTKKTKKTTTKSIGRKPRKIIYPGDAFWTKVVNGFNKLLSPPK